MRHLCFRLTFPGIYLLNKHISFLLSSGEGETADVQCQSTLLNLDEYELHGISRE